MNPARGWGRTALVVVLGAAAGCTGAPDVVAVTVGETGGASFVAADGGRAGAASAPLGGSDQESAAGGSAGNFEPSTLQTLPLTGDLEVHDSCIIEDGGRFFLFHTGPGIGVKTSDDLHEWRDAGSAFEQVPDWIAELVPEATTLWAPDVAWFNGVYHLYYAASTFGSGHSCIGHATKPMLNSNEPWTDQGTVICSDAGGTDDDWDAIDPSSFTDRDGQHWMVFGSFGSGIKLLRLDADGARDGDELLSLAQRPAEPFAIQAAHLHVRDDGYYLFVSFDWCCRGVDSTNHLRVGRSDEPDGPYVDRDGVAMLEGGGTLLLEGDERWRGVGANTLLTANGRDYNAYHSYDANAVGRATLRIAELAWDSEGWPVSGGP